MAAVKLPYGAEFQKFDNDNFAGFNSKMATDEPWSGFCCVQKSIKMKVAKLTLVALWCHWNNNFEIYLSNFLSVFKDVSHFSSFSEWPICKFRSAMNNFVE